MVDEAEEKQNKNPVVKLWLDELQDVVYRTEDLVDEMCTESLRHKLDAESQTKSLKSGMEYKDDHEVFCREANKDAIISLLLSDDVKSEQLSVIPIVGEVGVGKSTLARLVYNDCRVSQHFEIKAWYPVNHKMTKAISESFSLQSLQESLKGKRFLLVLDDVGSFNYADWESLQSTLKGVANGSCVIVTTRDSEVASKISTDFLGLPFAVKALGLLLRSTPQVEDWRVVLDRLKHFSLSRGMSGDGNELRKCYDELPAQLKRCFAYCSIFPKGYEFDKEKLVLLWMAEGLLQNRGKEDDGNKCFDELLSESFFQQSSANNSRFLMHDLVDDLAAHLSWKHFLNIEDPLLSNWVTKILKTQKKTRRQWIWVIDSKKTMSWLCGLLAEDNCVDDAKDLLLVPPVRIGVGEPVAALQAQKAEEGLPKVTNRSRVLPDSLIRPCTDVRHKFVSCHELSVRGRTCVRSWYSPISSYGYYKIVSYDVGISSRRCQ
ncbi:putative disease resistance RPP13-like protein 1 [Quercus robur]|uniref:putative disease resistance RPP13-like protein 1 n=1 Tax=Quercus robur TaxID=38942 RepID=UPI0021620FC3|nr:putative disease resistance RPP13-like protein 1 [Quercus robur]